MIDLKRYNVGVLGRGPRTMIFAHGFGCDQNMWRHLIGQFENDFRIVLFDYFGHGKSDVNAFNPQRYATLGPSPRYINDEDYEGGFTRAEIDSLLEFLDFNYLGWSSTLAPVIMGNPDRPEFSEELTNSCCRTDPTIAKHFARVTFFSDNRGDLATITKPCLIPATCV